jgi:integrase/recombinase XerD
LLRCGAKNRSWRPTARSLSWLVDYLRETGVVTVPAASRERSGEQVLIERYRDYLAVERGLEPVTISNYVRVVTQFLAA